MTVKKLEELLKGKTNVGISGHVKPDGDCVGSTLALYNYITEYYKDIKVTLYLEKIPSLFTFLKNWDKAVGPEEAPEHNKHDLFLLLDCGDKERCGFAQKFFDEAEYTVCVDHHISNTGYADENYILPKMSSTSEYIFYMLDEEKITKEIAECIYMGIIHDTGVFQYDGTSSKTMEVAGKLMDKGIDYTSIIDDSFFKKTFAQTKMTGIALTKVFSALDGKVVFSVITKSEMREYNALPEDLEGIVNCLRVIVGVEAGMFIWEKEPGEYKLSMRSNGKVNVAEIAAEFGGGGHTMAAGGRITEDLDKAIAKLTELVKEQLNS